MVNVDRDREKSPSAEGAGRKAAAPVVFDRTIGLYQSEDPSVPSRAAAVLIIPPWGFEEMCTRKFFRILAEHMAANGIPSFRFDYPGTGDALDGPSGGLQLGDWEDTVLAAAEKLKALSGRDKVILLGQGIGGLLAQRLGGRIAGVEAMALLAPALSGRAYLRELALWSKVVDQGLGLRDEQRDLDGVTIASLKMPPRIAEEIQRINITQPAIASARHYLLLERPVRLGNTEFADALRASGADVQLDSFQGYDDLVANPTVQKMPMEAVVRIVTWLKTVNPIGEHAGQAIERVEGGSLDGDAFSETPFRFGVNDHLYGVLCTPSKRISAASVLILTTAYDRNAGWGRTSVNIARSLAAHGIASFRYDTANVGDSVPVEDAPGQVLYSPTQNSDVTSALDLMEEHLGKDIIVAGRCSGGYLALRSAAQDTRLRSVVSINPFVFYWDPAKPVDEGLQFTPRSLDYYGKRIARPETLRRIISGEVNLPIAARNFVIAISRRIARRFVAVTRHLPGSNHVHREVKRVFRDFEDRSVTVSLIYSEGDIGIDDLHLHFGEQGKGLRAFNNVTLTMLPDTDHNITPAASRQMVFDEILRLARS